MFAILFWLERAGTVTPAFERLRDARMVGGEYIGLAAAARCAHSGSHRVGRDGGAGERLAAHPRQSGPAIARVPVPPIAVIYVKVFALVPALLATIVAVLIGDRTPVGGAAPLLVLSGLAVIVAAGDSIALHHQRILGYAWTGLLLVPALLVPAAIILLPWATGTDLRVAQPAAAMGRFFAESFERRTGHPLAVVSGDARTAALVALAAPSRPSVYFAFEPMQSPPA